MDMVSLTDEVTVPQVYFNEEHVGGATELLKVLDGWDEEAKSPEQAPYQRYLDTIQSKPDPTDPRLDLVEKPKARESSGGGGGGGLSNSSAHTNSSSIGSITSRTQRSDLSASDATDDDLNSGKGGKNKKDDDDDDDEKCEFGCVKLPNSAAGVTISLGDLTSELLNVLPCYKKVPYKAKVYYNCFPGDECIDVLIKHYSGTTKFQTRQDVVKFCRLLQSKDYGPILHHVAGGSGIGSIEDDHGNAIMPFQDSNDAYYRLQPYQEPHVLNSFYLHPRTPLLSTVSSSSSSPAVTTTGKHISSSNSVASASSAGETDTSNNEESSIKTARSNTQLKDPIALIQQLQSILQYLERKYTKSASGMDYIAAREDVKFEYLELASCQIQCIDISKMDDTTKAAFCLNLYNIMIQHAFIKLGIGTTSSARSAIFKQVCYQVAGCAGRDRIKLSLDDLEHGILRANTKHPYALRPQFTSKRLAAVLSLRKTDPRIHFALNCGANSCPPINYYTPDHLNEELELAAMSFCNQDSTINVNEAKNEIAFSMILKWYRSDFNVSAVGQLPQRIIPFLRGDKKKTVERMVEKHGSNIKIKFLPYDWGNNASRHESFESRDLDTSRTSVSALFKQYASITVSTTKSALGAGRKKQRARRTKMSPSASPAMLKKTHSRRNLGGANVETKKGDGNSIEVTVVTGGDSHDKKPPLQPTANTTGKVTTRTLDRVVQSMFPL